MLITVLIFICIIICFFKFKNKEKKSYIIIPLLFIILIIYIISTFGISFASKTTYNLANPFSNYEYKECFMIDKNLVLVVSEKKLDDEIDYSLSIQNKFMWLYFDNDKKYTQGIMVTGDDKLDVNYILYNNKYYYYFNNYKGIEKICIDNESYDISDLKTYIYISDKKIKTLEINFQTYFPYYVEAEFN